MNKINLFEAGNKNQQDREIWIEKALKQISQGSRILDAGAGEQQYKRFCSHLNYVSQDFARYDGKGDKKGLQTDSWDQSKLDIISDITSIPEKDSSFDAIMCIEVFEHLGEPIKAIREFSRLLKSRGYLILTAPFCSLTHFAPFHYYSGFNRYFYEKYLKENGFEIAEISANGNYFEYLAQETRRIPSIAKKYASHSLDLLEKMCIYLILRILRKLSRKDKGSSELLCYGYQILAKKL